MSQIDYTSRDFTAIRDDLVSLIKARTGLNSWDATNPSDLGAILVEAFAYMGDIMSYYIDRTANETSIDTAIKTSTLLNFANLYGYKPSGPTPAQVYVTFTNTGTSSLDIPKGTQVLGTLNYAPFTQVFFETTLAVTGLLSGASISILCQEGMTVNTDRPDLIDTTHNIALPANLGNSNGTANQKFDVLDIGVVDNSVTVYVGQGTSFAPWEYATSLAEYGPADLVYTTVQNQDGSLTIVFGDGVTGAIPATNQLVSIVYKSSVGATGNIKSGVITEVTFIPGDTNLDHLSALTVTNPAPATGGANGDDFTQLQAKIKAAIATRKRAVTLSDYEFLASQVPQVGKVKALANVYSAVNLYLQSQNDNTATPGLVGTTVAITGASGDGTTMTFTATNSFTPGQVVTIAGMDPYAYNVVGTVASAGSSSFTVLGTASASFVSGGTATVYTPTTTWSDLSTALSTYMSTKIPVGTTVTVAPPVYVPVYLDVTVYAASAYKQSDIKLAIYKAFLGSEGMFAYNNNAFADTVYFSSVIAAAANTDGVTSVTINKLNTNNDTSAADITFQPYQIPYLLPANLTISVSGGIL